MAQDLSDGSVGDSHGHGSFDDAPVDLTGALEEAVAKLTAHLNEARARTCARCMC